jgi:hypothetical protein
VEKMYLYSSMTLYTFFCCKERSGAEDMDVAVIFLTLKENNEEDKLIGIIYDLVALLGRDQGNGTRWDYLGYLVQGSPLSYNWMILHVYYLTQFKLASILSKVIIRLQVLDSYTT